MSRNGSGQYVPPSSSWSPAISGAAASYTDWNSLLADLTAALTQSVSSDGQTPITGNLNMGGNKLTNLAAGTGVGQTLQWQQLFSQGVEATIASAATVDIGAQNTSFLNVTGTTTITSFGTNYNGPRFLRFSGAVLLTNSATLVVPGGANLTTTAGDTCIVIPKATSGTADGWVVAAYRKNAIPLETAVTTDTSGNVGIGTSTPQAPLAIGSGSGAGSNPTYGGSLLVASEMGTLSAKGGIEFRAANLASGYGFRISSPDLGGGSTPLVFERRTNSAAWTESMRLDSSGNFLVGTTSGSGARFDVLAGASDEVASFRRGAGRTIGLSRFLSESGTTVGYIQWSGSTTSYVTSSDYRLKNTVEPMVDALSKVAALKPCTYKWNSNGSVGQGFIAHELQEVVPECVVGEKDAVDADGKPIYQGIDTSFLVATLTAAIQEQQTIIEQLRADVEALKAK